MELYIEYVLSQLTLEEKIGMIHGNGLFRTGAVERLGIPALCFSDGPMGVRGEYPDNEWRYLNRNDDFVTYLPCNSAIASTWNRELACQSGSVLGREARGRGKDVILAPGINIKRSPLCGRSFEYLSEDPYLVEELATSLVMGIQSQDVAACAKHFAANSQETQRLWVDSVVDERTLHEIYFPGFRAAIDRGGLQSIMGAYNFLNGEHCCTSMRLLNDMLRKKWGFDGVVVSDWGGVHDTVLAAKSGLDVEMGVDADFDHYFMAQPLLEKIRAGELQEALVNEKIRNILRLMMRLKMIGADSTKRKSGAYNTPEHRAIAKQVAEESIILLKNEKNILPLDANNVKTVAVIGGNAVTLHAFGGGSTEIKALYEISPLMGIKKHLGGNAKVFYVPGYGLPEPGSRPDISWQATSTTETARRPHEPTLSQANLQEAVELARQSDAVIFMGGLNHDYDVEGLDRQDMKLPYGQDAVIEALLEVRPDTVVVMMAGSPVEMPWLQKASTLVWSYYAGMEGGTALANVLFGEVNPSGKLAETFLKSPDDCPAQHGVNFGLSERVEYTEGVMVGYRHYDTVHTEVLFPFGHGLSYTNFVYSDLQISSKEVSFLITNAGTYAGSETAQLYVAPKGKWDIVRPAHQLRGFQKICLMPGESQIICFSLSEEDFSVYDVDKHAFCPLTGTYRIQIGSSSRDIRLEDNIVISAFGKDGLQL